MISLPKRGALSILSIEVERELDETDLLELKNLPANSPPPLKALTARHRRAALMVAEGKTNDHIADALGYTPTRIAQLRNDPGFMYTASTFEDQIHEIAIADEQRLQGKLRLMGEGALDEINDRLDDPAQMKLIPTAELRQLVTTAADRTFAPPKQANSRNDPPVNITLDFGRQLTPKDITPKDEGEAS